MIFSGVSKLFENTEQYEKIVKFGVIFLLFEKEIIKRP